MLPLCFLLHTREPLLQSLYLFLNAIDLCLCFPNEIPRMNAAKWCELFAPIKLKMQIRGHISTIKSHLSTSIVSRIDIYHSTSYLWNRSHSQHISDEIMSNPSHIRWNIHTQPPKEIVTGKDKSTFTMILSSMFMMHKTNKIHHISIVFISSNAFRWCLFICHRTILFE